MYVEHLPVPAKCGLVMNDTSQDLMVNQDEIKF